MLGRITKEYLKKWYAPNSIPDKFDPNQLPTLDIKQVSAAICLHLHPILFNPN